MSIKRITAAYFSPTGNAKKIAEHIASTISIQLQIPNESFDFTLPAAREQAHTFTEEDLLVLVMPVYASRVPNKMLPAVQTLFTGHHTNAIIVSTYGNRSFGDGLTELRDELTAHGFHVIAAAAIPSEHAFDDRLATGRPNVEDLAEIEVFAMHASWKLENLTANPESASKTLLEVPGNSPVGPYYTPLGTDGKPAVFLKAKPKTDASKCASCGACANACPMGSISHENFAEVSGICIKCHACIHTCPNGAKYFDDEAFLSHKAMLVENFTARKENAFFL